MSFDGTLPVLVSSFNTLPMLITSFNFRFLFIGEMTGVAPGGVNCGSARIPIVSLSSALFSGTPINSANAQHKMLIYNQLSWLIEKNDLEIYGR